MTRPRFVPVSGVAGLATIILGSSLVCVASAQNGGPGEELIKWTWMMDQMAVEGIVRRPEDGLDLILAINDTSTEDNTGSWTVYVTVNGSRSGPFSVADQLVHTGIHVPQQATVSMEASGTIYLEDPRRDSTGRRLVPRPRADPDGDPTAAPPDSRFPAPGLREFSLICKVGPQWYQGARSILFFEMRTGTDGPDQDSLTDNLDDFDLQLDPNYQHIVALQQGNNPTVWFFGPGAPHGLIHVEGYSDLHGITTLAGPPPYGINHPNPTWDLPSKPPQPFEIRDPLTGQRIRVLRFGDHVRLVGRWCIENEHEDFRWTRFRGLLKVGSVWAELHPFRWDSISLVRTPLASQKQRYMLALAAPIYEETYQRGGPFARAAGVKGRVFVAGDGSNYHNTVRANPVVKAPPLPVPFRPQGNLIAYREAVTLNGTHQPLERVRRIDKLADGIRISAAVVAPVFRYVNAVGTASIHDPAKGRSVFRAEYEVWWLPRLLPVESPTTHSASYSVELAPTADDTKREIRLYLWNRGRDQVLVSNIGWAIMRKTADGESNPASDVVRFPNNAIISVPPFSAVTLKGLYAPNGPGDFAGKIEIQTNDPARDQVVLDFRSSGIAVPKLEIAPANHRGGGGSVNFGDVQVGSSLRRTVTLRNVGNTAFSLSDLFVTNERPAEQFRLASVATSFNPIAPGESRTLDIDFAPTKAGHAQAMIRTTARTANPTSTRHFNIELSGIAIAPVVAVNPAGIHFGQQVLLTTSAPQTLTISNVGTAALIVNKVSSSSDYLISSNCQTVAVGNTCSVTAAFRPVSSGSRPSQLRIESNAIESPTIVPLVGFGVSAPLAFVQALSVDFGDQSLATRSPAKEVRLENRGTAVLRVQGATLTGVHSGDFIVESDSCTGRTVPPEQWCVVGLTFRPTVVGPRSAALLFSHNASATPPSPIPLTGTGTTSPAVFADMSEVQFGNQAVGTVSERVITVKNSGSPPASVDVTISGTDFGRNRDNCSGAVLASGQSCQVAAVFRSSVIGERTGELSLIVDGSVVGSVGLRGTGTGALLVFDPTTMSFEINQQPVGTFSAAETALLWNRGNIEIQITTIAITSEFQYSTTCGSILGPQTSCSFRVIFQPTATGLRTGTLAVVTSDGNRHELVLRGIGR